MPWDFLEELITDNSVQVIIESVGSISSDGQDTPIHYKNVNNSFYIIYMYISRGNTIPDISTDASEYHGDKMKTNGDERALILYIADDQISVFTRRSLLALFYHHLSSCNDIAMGLYSIRVNYYM